MSFNNLNIGDNISTNQNTICDCNINEKICNECDNILNYSDDDKESISNLDSDFCNNNEPNCRNMDKYHDVLIRGKYLFLNCKSFNDMINVLKYEIKHYEYLRDNGWKIREEGMQDDYCSVYNEDLQKYNDYENVKLE